MYKTREVWLVIVDVVSLRTKIRIQFFSCKVRMNIWTDEDEFYTKTSALFLKSSSHDLASTALQIVGGEPWDIPPKYHFLSPEN